MTSASAVGMATPQDGVAQRIVGVGVVLALVAAIGQTAVGLVNGLAFDGRFIQFDPDREFNVFAWASSSATFAAAFVALLAATVWETHRLRWSLLGLLLAFFSADDLLVIHERLTRLVFVDVLDLPPGFGARLVAVLYLPLLAAVFVIVVATARTSPAPARRGLVAGLVCLAAALLLEVANGALSALDRVVFRSPADVVLSTLEEGLELAGWTVIAASLAAVVTHGLVRARSTP